MTKSFHFVPSVPICVFCLAGVVLASVALLAPLGVAAAAGPDDKDAGPKQKDEPFSFLAYEPFDGKPKLNWQPVRHEPTHVSFVRQPGALTITTQRGSIHGDEKNDALGEGIQAKNIFLIDNPLSEEADFAVTTCVSGFTPDTNWQQAGLICYDDDDNYLKWGYEFDRRQGSQAFCVMSEANMQSELAYMASEPGLKRYWVRLTKRGNKYDYSFSTDGKEFKFCGARNWGDGSPKKMGLLAKNGGNKDAAEVDASFEFFELRSPIPAPADEKPKE